MVEWVAPETLGAILNWMKNNAYTLIMAIGALLGPWIAWKTLVEKQREKEPAPVFQARLAPVRGQPEWHRLTITMRQDPKHPATVRSLSMTHPRNSLLLPQEAAYAPRLSGNHPQILKDPLPTELAQRRILNPVFARDPMNGDGIFVAYTLIRNTRLTLSSRLCASVSLASSRSMRPLKARIVITQLATHTRTNAH